MKILYAVVAAMLLWAIIGSVMAADFVGQAVVADGDAPEIHVTRVRLWIIEAPESDQLCRGDDGLPFRCDGDCRPSSSVSKGHRPLTGPGQR